MKRPRIAAAAVLACAAMAVALLPASASATPTTTATPQAAPRLAPGLVTKTRPRSMAEVTRLSRTPAGRAQLSTVAGPDATTCQTDVYINSYQNGLYVSAELGWGGDQYGLLRARATQVGPWELFEECWYVDTSGRYVYTLRSEASGKYVSTEYDFGNNEYGDSLYMVLRARADSPGTWEHYFIGVPANWEMDLQSVKINRYVSAEVLYQGAYVGVLRARATQVGPWEIFGQG
jgi:hypothetical protein